MLNPRMKKRRAKRAKGPISLEDFRKNLELVSGKILSYKAPGKELPKLDVRIGT
jgi:hypothetical protein